MKERVKPDDERLEYAKILSHPALRWADYPTGTQDCEIQNGRRVLVL
ncbi:hypothetical protein EI42_01797 [Thermosporothrix hazakensis]|uniref:Uncharacterized protein n=1 Tax=Thermosporothrix hazakensis TaxID=644383 RepID=A0A326UBF3_THEHA|nr:hypothetical protein EI42_01797 [Thermosporothrix hazakensis]